MGNDDDDSLDKESIATLVFRAHRDDVGVHRTFVYFAPARPPRRAAAAGDDVVTQRLPRCD